MTKKTSKKSEEKSQIDKKQVIVAVIILIVAILMLSVAFNSFKSDKVETAAKVEEAEPQKEPVVVNFTTETEGAVDYTIYYTTSANDMFSDEKSIHQSGQAGLNTYSVTLPVSEISRFRLSFSQDAGNVKVISITLSGAQTEDLSGFTSYEMFMMDNITLNDDGSLSFTSTYPGAGLTYIPILGTVIMDEENPVMIPEEEVSGETTEENVATEETPEAEENAPVENPVADETTAQ